MPRWGWLASPSVVLLTPATKKLFREVANYERDYLLGTLTLGAREAAARCRLTSPLPARIRLGLSTSTIYSFWNTAELADPLLGV